MYISVTVQQDDFDIAQLYKTLRKEEKSAVGAIAAFSGLVRERNVVAGDGGQVQSLTLEHYPGMTEKSIHKIVERAAQRWPLLGACVVHRVGTLCISEQIVAVLVSSAHRDAAFAAAEFVMDYLKTEAVLWKREVSDKGTAWLSSTSDDRVRASSWSEPDT